MSFKILGIGEVLWDLLPSGPQLGGAPGNFAYHAHALGASACVVTRVGDDNFGLESLRRFEELGIADGTVQVDDTAPTGTVSVSLSEKGNPDYIIHEDAAFDRLEVTPKALNAVREADAICFGTLAQRSELSRNSIQRLVATASANALRVFDINLRQSYFSREVIEASLRLANVFKLNDNELWFLAGMFDLKGSTRNQIEELAKKFDLHLVALTRGPAGSLLFQGGKWSDSPSVPIQVVDSVGAGDAFLFPPGEAHQLSNPGPEDLVYYVIADNPLGECAYYPDSKKWLVARETKLKKLIADSSAKYYDGEE